MGLFGSSVKKKVEPELTIKEEDLGPLKRMRYEKLIDDDSTALSLIESYKNNCPLCVNFCDLNEISNNKMLAFLSGAVVALGGNIIELRTDVYIFLNEKDFLEEEMKDFIQEKKSKE